MAAVSPPVFILPVEEHNRGIISDILVEMAAGGSHPLSVISTCSSEIAGMGGASILWRTGVPQCSQCRDECATELGREQLGVSHLYKLADAVNGSIIK